MRCPQEVERLNSGIQIQDTHNSIGSTTIFEQRKQSIPSEAESDNKNKASYCLHANSRGHEALFSVVVPTDAQTAPPYSKSNESRPDPHRPRQKTARGKSLHEGKVVFDRRIRPPAARPSKRDLLSAQDRQNLVIPGKRERGKMTYDLEKLSRIDALTATNRTKNACLHVWLELWYAHRGKRWTFDPGEM